MDFAHDAKFASKLPSKYAATDSGGRWRKNPQNGGILGTKKDQPEGWPFI
jgi:hypothetical protein